jgi:APA family basic amino acid/polyamine antiporter
MAAVAVTFAKYFLGLMNRPKTDLSAAAIAAVALALVTVINCFGVRAGSRVQSALMVMKIAALLLLIGAGFWWLGANGGAADISQSSDQQPGTTGLQPATDYWLLATAFGAAMVPVLFAYGGWQTANFIAGEVREPRRNLPRGLLIGVMGVVALYLSVNFIYVAVLGANGLAATETPASSVMQRAFGAEGETIIAIGIVISTLGFLSQAMLTAPRVYFAMADDRLFFRSVAWLHPRTRVPVVAIALQGALAIVIALSGTYGQILNYVVSVDSIFFALTAATIFYFRRARATVDGSKQSRFRVPGHPYTTLLFIIIETLVAVNTFYKKPKESAIGLAILLAGIPVYFFWRNRQKR